MRKIYLLICIYLIICSIAFSQSITITPSTTGNVQNNRLTYSQILAIPNPQSGMMAYDLTYDCLRIYNGNEWCCLTCQTASSVQKLLKFSNPNTQDAIFDLAIDGADNIYVTGASVMGTITKLSPSGKILWSKSAYYYGGPATNSETFIDVDLAGNVYVTAGIYGGNYYNASFGCTQFTNDGVIVAKLNTDGICQWANVYANGAGKDIKVDASGSIYVAGVYDTSINFGGNSTPLSNSSSGYPYYNKSGFLAKFNSSGICQWATDNGLIGVNTVQIALNDVTTTGRDIFFASSSVSGSTNGLLRVFNSSGTFQSSAPQNSSSYKAESIFVKNGKVYFSTYDKSSTPHTISIYKSDPNIVGGYFLTVYTLNVTEAIIPFSATFFYSFTCSKLLVDNNDNIYLTGHFKGTATDGTNSITAGGAGPEILIAKIAQPITGTPTATLKIAGNASSSAEAVVCSFALNGNSNLLLVGQNVGVGPSYFNGTPFYGSAGNSDIFFWFFPF